WHKVFFMQTKKESYWFLLRMLLLVNVILITVIVLAHSGRAASEKDQEPCCKARKVNADVLNSIAVKLM
ncbi:MAG TPA: hypothetical protein VGG71_15270, partial [Chitinophagaceae bacterium]